MKGTTGIYNKAIFHKISLLRTSRAQLKKEPTKKSAVISNAKINLCDIYLTIKSYLVFMFLDLS